MWCIGRITAEYRERMYDLLGLYAKPYDAAEPVVCLDEKSKQLLEQTRRPIPAVPGQIAKEDYEYKRAGTRNLFVAVEPKGGHREVEVTRRRTKPDFVAFVQFLALEVYAQARKIHLVMDNLNTHFRASFEEVMGMEAASGVPVATGVPLHSQARQLAQHGRDRDRDFGSAMHRAAYRRRSAVALRSAAPGSNGEIKSVAGLTGSSPARMPTENYRGTM